MAIKKAKKSIKKPVVKAAVKPVAAPAATCTCATGCCKRGFWKKLILVLIVFVLGFACCKFLCHGPKHFGKNFGHEKMFVNGCLDTTKFECPEMAQKVALADADSDGCITKAEFKAFKKAAQN